MTDYRVSDGNYILRWIDDLKQLKSENTYFITNELFDAYPIHKFQVSDCFVRKVEQMIICFVENSTRLERSDDRMESCDKTTSICSISSTNNDESIV